jgi:flagellar hook-length control protein FliK
MNVTTNNFAAPSAAPASGPAPSLVSDAALAPQAQIAAPFAQWLVQDEPIPPVLPDLQADAAGSADAINPVKADAPAATDSDDAEAPRAAQPDGALLAAMSMPLMAPAAAPAPTAAPGAAPSAADPTQMMALTATPQFAGTSQLAPLQSAGTSQAVTPQFAGTSQSAALQSAGTSQAATPQSAGTSQSATPAPSAAAESLAAAAAAQLAATLAPAPRAASPAPSAAPGAAMASAPASLPAAAPEALAATATQPGNAGNAAAGNGNDTGAQDNSSASAAAPVWGVAAPAAGSQPRAADTVALAGPPAAWRQPLQEALGERLQMQLGSRMDQAVIRLEPPMLGRVEISIRHTAGALEVSLTATHSEVVRQLQTVSENLRNDLAGRQYTEVAVSVSQAPRAQAANPNAFADQQGGRQRQGAREQQDAEPGLALADAGNSSSTFSLNGRE